MGGKLASRAEKVALGSEESAPCWAGRSDMLRSSRRRGGVADADAASAPLEGLPSRPLESTLCSCAGDLLACFALPDSPLSLKGLSGNWGACPCREGLAGDAPLLSADIRCNLQSHKGPWCAALVIVKPCRPH